MTWATDKGFIEHDMTTGMYKVYDNWGILITETKFIELAVELIS